MFHCEFKVLNAQLVCIYSEHLQAKQMDINKSFTTPFLDFLLPTPEQLKDFLQVAGGAKPWLEST